MMPRVKAGPSTTPSESGSKPRKVLKEVQPREMWVKKSDKIFDSSSEDEEIAVRVDEVVVTAVEQEIVVDNEEEEIEAVPAKTSRSRSRSVSVPMENNVEASGSVEGGVGSSPEQNKPPPKTRERKAINYTEATDINPPRSSAAIISYSNIVKIAKPIVESFSAEVVVEEAGESTSLRFDGGCD